MKFPRLITFLVFILFCLTSRAQTIEKKSIAAKKISGAIKIDGILDDAAWKDAPVADRFTQFQPTPFLPESKENESQVYFLYNNEGVYMGGYLHEKNRDSIATELNGRDGFGNNDFVGVIFDTYQDKLNGFEYFLTPLNEQMDAKTSSGEEDFSWNAVWRSAVQMHQDGWSFEMFIPYSAIRFGKKNIQDWGINIVRQRTKSGQKLTWQMINPNVNGFLPQEGTITGFENIVPPLRLQLSPYFSTYYNHDDNAEPGTKKSSSQVNGGMDVKYGINQAFTIDMTLIPDFGQVQTDNLTLNLSPFEQQFSENRAFFTEGTELFNKGNLFYSRRIGGQPLHFSDVYTQTTGGENVVKNPSQSKLINATKLSGRTQKGLGIGVLNAITKPQFALIENAAGEKRKYETDPLTNYNVFVLDQTFKNNSSISFVNTSVLRSGTDYDADVAAVLFDFNNKPNTRNIGGNISISNVVSSSKTTTGYSHNIYFGKRSGRFNYNISQNLTDNKFDKSDLGYFTNNNALSHNISASYNWNTPKNWYNRININASVYHSRLVSPLDIFKGRSNMFQTADFFLRGNMQTKKLQFINVRTHIGSDFNDFYEARSPGRVFRNKGSRSINLYYQTNETKRFSASAGLFTGTGGVFKRTSFIRTLVAR